MIAQIYHANKFFVHRNSIVFKHVTFRYTGILSL